MAEKKIYFGSVGPFLYDDTDTIDDVDGDFAGETYEAVVTSGQLYVETAPSKDEHVVRRIDVGGTFRLLSVANIDNPTELNALTGVVGDKILAYQASALGYDLHTIYVFDGAVTAAASPYVVAGSAGYWIAIGGRYTRSVKRFGQNSTDYFEIEADGTLVFLGAATVWDDLRVAAVAAKLGGVKDPGFTVFLTNGAGSQGVFLYWFDAAVEEELYFAVQLPHSYKEGTNITPHVHWVPKTNGAVGEVVSWGLEYAWANNGVTFGNTTIIYTNTHNPADNPLVASRQYKSFFAAIAGAGKTISSMLVCRLFRDATATGLTDSYTDDAGLLEIDFHYEQDTVGSRTITGK